MAAAVAKPAAPPPPVPSAAKPKLVVQPEPEPEPEEEEFGAFSGEDGADADVHGSVHDAAEDGDGQEDFGAFTDGADGVVEDTAEESFGAFTATSAADPVTQASTGTTARSDPAVSTAVSGVVASLPAAVKPSMPKQAHDEDFGAFTDTVPVVASETKLAPQPDRAEDDQALAAAKKKLAPPVPTKPATSTPETTHKPIVPAKPAASSPSQTRKPLLPVKPSVPGKQDNATSSAAAAAETDGHDHVRALAAAPASTASSELGTAGGQPSKVADSGSSTAAGSTGPVTPSVLATSGAGASSTAPSVPALVPAETKPVVVSEVKPTITAPASVQSAAPAASAPAAAASVPAVRTPVTPPEPWMLEIMVRLLILAFVCESLSLSLPLSLSPDLFP